VSSGKPTTGGDVCVPVPGRDNTTMIAPSGEQSSSSSDGTVSGSSISASESRFSGYARVDGPGHGFQPLSQQGVLVFFGPGGF